MRAIMVCVDYVDLLSITLPWNKHHFEEVWVVSSTKDTKTHEVSKKHGAKLYLTDAFWYDGAKFNKFKALEQGLDAMERHGWLCIMDADVLWPKRIDWNPGGHWHWGVEQKESEEAFIDCDDMSWERYSLLQAGKLYTPLRRMWNAFPSAYPKEWGRLPIDGIDIPDEAHWSMFPIHRNVTEWAGYSQIFHASDPALGPPPWHEVDYTSAGTVDSLFQRKWPKERKVRPPFEVLHLGPNAQNWCGRVTPYLDGSVPSDAARNKQALSDMLLKRRGKAGMGRFDHERLK